MRATQKTLSKKLKKLKKSFLSQMGGCRLSDLSISQVIEHVTCYKFKCSHWWKIYLKKIFTRFALQCKCCNFNQ